MSYEIRTPLTSVLGFAESLHMGIAGELSPKQKEYVLDIRKSSEELKTIIDAIIDLSAIDAGAMELKLADRRCAGHPAAGGRETLARHTSAAT